MSAPSDFTDISFLNIMDRVTAILYFNKAILIGHTQNYTSFFQFSNIS